MDNFPFTIADWQKVADASLAVTNAALTNDEVLRASYSEELKEVLEELRSRHGEHPILWETEADFEDDPFVQREKNRSAIQLAEKHSLLTYSIRISLARILLDDFNDPVQAARALESCQRELTRFADESEKMEWVELMNLCKECSEKEESIDNNR